MTLIVLEEIPVIKQTFLNLADLKEGHLQDQPHACRDAVDSHTSYIPFPAANNMQMLCEKDIWEE